MPGGMVVGGLSPLNRVHEILQRMIDNPRHIESLKTCCGVLAILSRDEANKLLIARDGIRLICSVMEQHVERHDLLEAACDLLWSLAFNNPLLKEVIGQQGGIPIILRGMKIHPATADFLKSACGALSNMCQNAHNQTLIASNGGIFCMLQVLENHRKNTVLLPFAFDALASLIVGNQDNGRKLSEAGAITAILSLMEEHVAQGELVKSGCHALAILSDNRGEGSKIAQAGGVRVLLPILWTHPTQVDLHRVAAVVLLRMLQEAPVACDMARSKGVPLMLNVLLEQIEEVETVAAGCHILYSITHAEALKGPPPIDLEDHLKVGAGTGAGVAEGLTGVAGNGIRGVGTAAGKSGGGPMVAKGKAGLRGASSARAAGGGAVGGAEGKDRTEFLTAQQDAGVARASAGTLAVVLRRHAARKDVARACVRSVINLSRFPTALAAFVSSGVLEPILAAVSLHPSARDITEGALTMLKLVGARQQSLLLAGQESSLGPLSSSRTLRRGNSLSGDSGSSLNSEDNKLVPLPPACVTGMLACVKARPGDAAAAAVIFRHLEAMLAYESNHDARSQGHQASSGSTAGGQQMASWEQEGVKVCLTWARLHGQNMNLSSSSSSSSNSSSDVTKLKGNTSDVVALANALSALCRFLHGFASKLPPGLAALRMLDTGTIVRNLEGRVRSEVSGDVGTEVRRSVNMLLALLGSHDPHVPRPSGPSANGDGPIERRNSVGSDGKSNPSPLGMVSIQADATPVNGKDSSASQSPATGIGGVKSDLSDGSISIGKTAVSSVRGGRATNRPTPGRGLLQRKALLNNSRRGLDVDGNAIKRLESTGNNTSGSDNHRFSVTDANDGVDADGFIVGGGKCNCRHGSASIYGGRQKRPRPVHPLEAGLDRTLLWKMPTYTEPISMDSCGNPAATQAILMNEQGEVSRRMHIVYEGSTAAGGGVLSRVMAPAPYLVPLDTGMGQPYEHSLTFDACFESGNLLRAVQRGNAEYDLFIRADLHTEGHMQWFYFAVGNTHPPTRPANSPTAVKFNVVNLTKPDSLFNQGMQPLLFSTADAERDGTGWVRSGRDISYYSNPYARGGSGNRDAEGGCTYYSLTFTIDFAHAGDTWLLTNSYPFTYSDHKYHLGRLFSSPFVRRHATHSILCQTLGNNDCDLLTVTEDGKDEMPLGTGEDSEENGKGKKSSQRSTASSSTSGSMVHPSRRKKCIVITGRVHPGETQASWMMKGILDFLTSDSPQARLLRSLFVFKVVPMLNPDGVFYGNNRCSLAGVDLNRQWKKPSRTLHPTIYYTKSMIRSEKSLRDVVLYCDLHGHSRKMNVFMYGCDDKKKPRPMTRIFPKLLSWNTLGNKYLSFQDCSFAVKKARETTARVVVAKELGIPNSYTVEGTFAGLSFGNLKNMHMNGNHFQEMGYAICDTMLDYYIPNRTGHLSDTEGPDGIAVNSRVAHALSNVAKTLQYAGAETSESEEKSTSNGTKKENGEATSHTKIASKPGENEPSLGLKVAITAETSSTATAEVKSDERVVNDAKADISRALDAPPSPEQVLASAANANPDGSPSNTKVLEALKDEMLHEAANSANGGNGDGIDEADDVDSGSEDGGENTDIAGVDGADLDPNSEVVSELVASSGAACEVETLGSVALERTESDDPRNDGGSRTPTLPPASNPTVGEAVLRSNSLGGAGLLTQGESDFPNEDVGNRNATSPLNISSVNLPYANGAKKAQASGVVRGVGSVNERDKLDVIWDRGTPNGDHGQHSLSQLSQQQTIVVGNGSGEGSFVFAGRVGGTRVANRYRGALHLDGNSQVQSLAITSSAPTADQQGGGGTRNVSNSDQQNRRREVNYSPRASLPSMGGLVIGSGNGGGGRHGSDNSGLDRGVGEGFGGVGADSVVVGNGNRSVTAPLTFGQHRRGVEQQASQHQLKSSAATPNAVGRRSNAGGSVASAVAAKGASSLGHPGRRHASNRRVIRAAK